MSDKVRIALDAMGGDHGPAVVVAGADLALTRHPGTEFLFFGNTALVAPLVGGVVDLGALATEFLILGLDPYPRKPGAVFEAPQEVKPDPGPFAALAGLKEKNGR